MSSPKTAPPLRGQTIGSPDGAFVIAEWQDPGGHTGPSRPIAPRHLHRDDDEAWYVLEGTLVVQVGNDEVEVRAGSAVHVPRNTPHAYWNPAPERARYLLVMTSNIFRLIQEIHAMSDRSRPALQAVFRKYNSVLLDG